MVGFTDSSAVKNPPTNAGDRGSIPGSGRSPEKEMANHSSIPTWEIPSLQSLGSQRVCDGDGNGGRRDIICK